MSEAAQTGPRLEPAASAPGHRIRAAGHEDVDVVVESVRELLAELGGTPAGVPAMRAAVRAILDSPAAGIVLLAEAEAEDAVVGVLAASWQIAIHVPGSYALIQDLWVHPAWRSRSLGAELVTALVEAARARDMERVEVGLPRERFAGFAATEAFYLSNDFQPLGPRMRRVLG
jgi:branched-chain amino acid aminotransferase